MPYGIACNPGKHGNSSSFRRECKMNFGDAHLEHSGLLLILISLVIVFVITLTSIVLKKVINHPPV